MAIENTDKLRKFDLGGTKISDSSDKSKRMREIMAEGKKQLEEELEQRRKQLKEEKERQSKLPEGHWQRKESFDAYKVMRGLDPYDSEEQIQRSLQSKERIESLEMEYYLDFPDFKTNAKFVNFLNSEDY